MVKEFLGKVAEAAIEHQPLIATAVLVGSIIITGVVIYKESPKIHKAMEERKEDLKDVEDDEEMTEKEKEETVEAVNKDTLKKVGPSIAKIVGAAVLTAGAIAFLNTTVVTITATAIAGTEMASQKVEAFKEVIRKETPDKADDIEAKVDKKIAEAFAKYHGGEINENVDLNTGKMKIFDEFGNTWYGYYTDVVAAKNVVNDFINDGDDVTLNQFYMLAKAPETIFGKRTYFPEYKGLVEIKPKAITNPNTGIQEAILIMYEANSPIVDDKKYLKSSERAARERAGFAYS